MSSYGSTASAIGNIDDPEYDRLRGSLVVYDPRYNTRQTQLFRDWGQNRKQWKDLFGNWMKDFAGQTQEYNANVGKENEFLTWLRDPNGFESKLGSIRATENANDRLAQETEKKLALDFADNRANFGRVLSGAPGSSSAETASRLASGKRIGQELMTRYLGRDTARERGDLQAVTNARLSTAGAINRNLDLILNRQLRPQQLSDVELNNSIAALNAIGSGTPLGAQPEFHVKANSYDKVGQWIDAGMSVYGQAYGSTPAANGALGGTSTGSTGGSPYGGGGPGGGGVTGGGPSSTGYIAQVQAPDPVYVPQTMSFPRSADITTPAWYSQANFA